jgi:hypothetical protein
MNVLIFLQSLVNSFCMFVLNIVITILCISLLFVIVLPFKPID